MKNPRSAVNSWSMPWAERAIALGRTHGVGQLARGAVQNPDVALVALKRVSQRYLRARRSTKNMSARPAPQRSMGTEFTVDSWTGPIQSLADKVGVLLLSEDSAATRIGVADVNLLLALNTLAGGAPVGAITVDGKALDLQNARDRVTILLARRIVVTARGAHGGIEQLVVEGYAKREPQLWVSPNSRNMVARALYDDRLERVGLTSAEELLGARLLHAAVREAEVDVVYTWVNHEDPDWARMFASYSADAGPSPDHLAGDAAPRPTSQDAMALSRFHSNDELRYSLRSVADHLPWVRTVYVLTNCAPPAWLDTDNPRIRWIRHEDVIPERFLPTFSSHAIETFLHHIPGISEQFVYVNDDVFFGNRLGKGFFFTAQGKSRPLLEGYAMVSGAVVEGAPDYLNAARNSARLLRDRFGFAATRLHRHTSFALRKDVLMEIEQQWPQVFEAVRRNRFRTAEDINLTSFLYHHYALATDRAVGGSGTNAFVKAQDLRWRSGLEQLYRTRPDIICINEGGQQDMHPDWHAEVRAFLESRWPTAAPWEHPDVSETAAAG